VPDGGFIITGMVKTNSNDKCYLMKFDSSGQVNWLKTYSDLIEFYSYGVRVINVPGEGYLCGGVMFHDTISNEEFTLLKCDLAGNLLWSKEFGNPFDDDELSSMLLLYDGILLAGHTTAFGPGGEDFFVVKTDSSGNLRWMKSYGTGADERCVKVLPYQHGFVAGGYGYSPGNEDMFLLFLDSAGGINNSVKIDIPGVQRMYDLAVSTAGDLLLAATHEAVTGSPKALFLQLNSGGSVTWCKEITGDNSVPNRVEYTPGGFVAAGATWKHAHRENAFVISMDPACNIVSENYFGDSTGWIFNSVIPFGDTLQLAGTYLKPGALFPSIYLNRYLPGDTTCNHFTQNSTLQDIPANITPVTWQSASPATPGINPVVLGMNFAWNDSVVCDFNPSARALPAGVSFLMNPNPAGEIVALRLPDEMQEASVTLVSPSGDTVLHYRVDSKTSYLPTGNLAPGLYTVILRDKSFSLSQRLIIQR
jgi:hypothetical protein